MTLLQTFKLMTQYQRKMIAASRAFEVSQNREDFTTYNDLRFLYLEIKGQFDQALESWDATTEELVSWIYH